MAAVTIMQMFEDVTGESALANESLAISNAGQIVGRSWFAASGLTATLWRIGDA